MAKFVRTTGGLLQLEERQVTKADYDRVARFAAGLLRADAAKAAPSGQPPAGQNTGGGQVGPLSRTRPGPAQAAVSAQAPAAASSRRKLVDLQAAPPAVFLQK